MTIIQITTLDHAPRLPRLPRPVGHRQPPDLLVDPRPSLGRIGSPRPGLLPPPDGSRSDLRPGAGDHPREHPAGAHQLTAAAAPLHLLPEPEPATAVAPEEAPPEVENTLPETITTALPEAPEEHHPEPSPAPLSTPLRPVTTASSGASKRSAVDEAIRLDPEASSTTIATLVCCSDRYVRDIRSRLVEGAAA